MQTENLTEDNYLIYAAKAYDSPGAVTSEFDEDINRIKYIKRLFSKYRTSGDLKERLILNHIIILFNVLGNEACTRILFLKIGVKYYPQLKTFLLFLNRMPDVVQKVNGSDIISADIKVDFTIAEILRNIIHGEHKS